MILQPSEVEDWVRQAFPFPHYVSTQKRVEQPDKVPPRVHVTTTIEGPQQQRIELNGRRAVYYSLEDMEGMPQMESEWVA